MENKHFPSPDGVKLAPALMATHLLNAAVFANAEEGTFPEPNEAARRNAQMYCEQFIKVAHKQLQEVLQYPEYWSHPDCANRAEAAIGHDLWLEVSGTGAGFGDRSSLPKSLREELSAQAQRFETIYHHFEQEGDVVHLSAPVRLTSVLLTPQAPMDDLALQDLRSKIGHGLSERGVYVQGIDAAHGDFTIHSARGECAMRLRLDRDALVGTMEMTNPDLKDWGQLRPVERHQAFADRHELLGEVVSAASRFGVSCQLLDAQGQRVGSTLKVKVEPVAEPSKGVDALRSPAPQPDSGPGLG